MIYNVNYYYSTFENIKDDLIEAYVRYYGEEYRDQIEEKINKVKYYPFHNSEYVKTITIRISKNFVTKFWIDL